MNENKTHTKLITAEHRWLQLNLKEVWKYRDLIWLFTKRSFEIQLKPAMFSGDQLGVGFVFVHVKSHLRI